MCGTAVCSANVVLTFTFFLLKNYHSGYIVGCDWVFWTNNVTEQRFEEQCIQFNKTLFTCVILQDQKKLKIIVG
jgi:hypothetical protein